MSAKCCLCHTLAPATWPMPGGEVYHACPTCGVITLAKKFRLARDAERDRYLLHQTSPHDEGYRFFVRHLLAEVGARFGRGARGLDYGAGHQPVLGEWLRQAGYEIDIYDSFFWPDVTPLQKTYEFVVMCEVVEHFFDPRGEFRRLAKLVEPGGALIVQTEPAVEQEKFRDWYYRRDPAHVTFYSPQTFAWLGHALGFAEVKTEGRVSVLKRAP